LPTPARAASSAEAPHAVSPLAPGYAARLSRIGRESFVVSDHAGGRYAGTVYASAEAVAPAREGRDLPVGAEIVMSTTVRASHRDGPTFFMQKQATGWSFGVMESPDARPEERMLCARCHAEAPHDSFFALPE
jgi:hypothetical protein